MKTVYFVRHGETEGNAGNFFQDSDTALNKKGLSQAVAVAERCANLPFETLLTSTMTRALQTAAAVSARTGKSIETSDLFKERHRPDELSGRMKTDPDVEEMHEKWRASIFSGGPRFSNGENFDDLNNRASKALDFLLHHPSEHIAVVTHGFFLRFLVAKTIFGDALRPAQLAAVLKTFRTNNTGITMFQFGVHPDNDSNHKGEHWIVRVWNDHAHLG